MRLVSQVVCELGHVYCNAQIQSSLVFVSCSWPVLCLAQTIDTQPEYLAS